MPTGGWISIALYDEAISCVARRSRPSANLVGIYLSDPGNEFAAGSYPVEASDGGRHASVYRFQVTDAGSKLFAARSGTVTVTSVEPCSLAGSFSAEILLTDGGGSPLSGSFSSAYCQ